ncbi:MAG: amidohydrolase family protein [Deltaproteobacteria bacterium]|nr:amidohydrolase family protein [Deltaproteobacteria bacterium]
MMIDSFVHIRPFSAQQSHLTQLPFLDRRIDRLFDRLNSPGVDRLYNMSMDLLNMRDNRFMPRTTARTGKLVQRIALGANLPFCSSKSEEQLLASMSEHGIDRAIVSAIEPFSDSRHVLGVCSRNPKLLPVVSFTKDEKDVGALFAHYLKKGARGVHLHPVLERTAPQSERYFELADLARSKHVPVICRTGVTSYLGRFDANLSDIRNYEALVKGFPECTFIMTHSNLADYRAAIDFAKKHPNCYLDTAWQTRDSIRNMIRALGSERILLASGWPVLGNQQKVQLRILAKLGLPTDDFENISWRNASRIFRL